MATWNLGINPARLGRWLGRQQREKDNQMQSTASELAVKSPARPKRADTSVPLGLPAPAAINVKSAHIARRDDGDKPYYFLETREVSIGHWINIQSNPQQRSEVERINKGRANHLLTFDESHRKVDAAILPDGTTYKVDGHTRTQLWKSGAVPSPKSVFVTYWACRDIAAVMSLYDKFDSPLTGETGPDRVTGAARNDNLQFDSPMLRSGEISTAMRALWTFLERKRPGREQKASVITAAVHGFRKELADLDAIGPGKRRFPPGVVAAALLTMRVMGEPAGAFWKAYAQGRGTKVAGYRDAVAVFEDRLPSLLKKQCGVREREIMQDAAAAVAAYSKERMYSTERGYTSFSQEKLRLFAKGVTV